MDALVSTAARQPLAFTTPSSSFSQSRLDKGRPVSMALASSSTPISLPPAAKSATSAHGFPFLAPATPSSPNTPAAFGLTTAAPPSHDEHMVDAFVTPPPATRSSASHATSGVRATLSPLSLDSSPSNGRLPSKKMKSKLLQSPSDAMPLTPPLTPPYDQHPSLPSGLAAPASPSPPPKPATVSARALQHHRLHPLFAATYTLCEELGSGGFGFVVRAERNHDGLSVAVKFIERAKIPSHAWVKSRSWGDTPGLTQPSGPKLVPMEAFVLRSIRHEGVVAFIDLFEDDKYFYLVRSRFLPSPEHPRLTSATPAGHGASRHALADSGQACCRRVRLDGSVVLGHGSDPHLELAAARAGAAADPHPDIVADHVLVAPPQSHLAIAQPPRAAAASTDGAPQLVRSLRVCVAAPIVDLLMSVD